MSNSMLFGYTVEEGEQTLVITISGLFAKQLSKYLRDQINSGQTRRVLNRLVPINSLGALMSQQVDLVGPAASDDSQSMSVEEIFRQGFNQSLSGFSDELEQLRAALAGTDAPPVSD